MAKQATEKAQAESKGETYEEQPVRTYEGIRILEALSATGELRLSAVTVYLL